MPLAAASYCSPLRTNAYATWSEVCGRWQLSSGENFIISISSNFVCFAALMSQESNFEPEVECLASSSYS